MTALCQYRAQPSHDHRTARAWLQGFSTAELLVVLAIAGILTALALPSIQVLLQGNRISGELSALMNEMQFVRAEAQRTGQFVSICISSNGSTCNVSSGDWRNGWIVFSDQTGNGQFDPGDTVLRVHEPFSSTDTLQSNPITSAIAFNRNGFATGLSGDVLVRAKVTPDVAQLTRCMSLNVVGRMQLQTPTSHPSSCQ